MKSRYHKFGFTLVELIVVITILAILWTIAFMAFSWYSKNSRDSVRATDLSAIKTSLELFQMKAWFLPDPSGAIPMTYSGGSMTVWNQWTFGDSVMQNVEKLSTKPVDPLFGTEYTYSVTNGKTEFEIGWVVEWDSQVSWNFFFNQANAQNVIQQALIQWNYNWKVLKVEMGWVLYIFALPSIITSDLSTVDVETQVLNKLLSYNGYGTIPASFSWTTTSTADSFDFGWAGTNIVVFSGAIDDLQNINNLKTFTLNLQNAYSGSVLVNNQDYATLMAIDPENDDLINSEIAYLINNNLGGDITSNSVNLWGGGGGPVWIPNLFTYSAWMNFAMKCTDQPTICENNINKWVFWITQDNNWVIWFTTEKWVISYDGTNYTLFNNANTPIIPASNLRSITYDEIRDLLWITSSTWIVTYDGTTWAIYNSTNTPSLPANGSNGYRAIYVDSSDNVWIGHDGSGLIKYNGTSWTVYNNSSATAWELNNNVSWWITQDGSGKIWVWHTSGTSYFDGTAWQDTATPFSFSAYNTSAMYTDSTWKIWLNDFFAGKVKTYDGSIVGTHTFSFPVVTSFTEDELGNIYLGGSNTLRKYDWTTWSDLASSINASATVRSLFTDANGRVWIGTTWWSNGNATEVWLHVLQN